MAEWCCYAGGRALVAWLAAGRRRPQAGRLDFAQSLKQAFEKAHPAFAPSLGARRDSSRTVGGAARGAGLFVRSLRKVEAIDLGFQLSVSLAWVDPNRNNGQRRIER